MSAKTEKMYSLKEAADMMGYAVSTVRDKIRRKKIAYAQSEKNGRVLIPASEVERFLKEKHTTIEAENSQSEPAPIFQCVDKTRVTQITTDTQPATAAHPTKQPEREYYSIGGL
jgi:excisionase family DNA binding protein